LVQCVRPGERGTLMTPGMNNGTGQPITFQCSKCRKFKGRWNDKLTQEKLGHLGRVDRVTLTGKKWPRDNAYGARNDSWAREYVCDDCGHKGSSRHVDLKYKEEKLADAAAKITMTEEPKPMMDKIKEAMEELGPEPNMCNRCRLAVSRLVLHAMDKGESGVSAGLKCQHCGGVWAIRVNALSDDECAEVDEMIGKAPHSEKTGPESPRTDVKCLKGHPLYSWMIVCRDDFEPKDPDKLLPRSPTCDDYCKHFSVVDGEKP
jgi:hypothetical protein